MLIFQTVYVHSQAFNNPDEETTTPSQSTVEQQQKVTDAVQNTGNYNGPPPTSGLSISAASGIMNIPAGSQISVSTGIVSSSKLTSASTKSGIKVSSCTQSTISRDGFITASFCEFLTVGPTRFKDVRDVVADGNSITFQSAESGTILSPVVIPYSSLGVSKFTFLENVIQTASTSFTSDSKPFDFQNPLAFDSGQWASYNRIDSDGDGLSDYVEHIKGTNPNVKDTDGDGLSDYEEFLIYPTNASTPYTYTNQILNQRGGTNPDFVTDGEFVQWAKTHFSSFGPNVQTVIKNAGLKEPNLWMDSDGDGISDFIESGLYQGQTNRLDIHNPDTDGDGWLDGEELANGWNPLDPANPPKISASQQVCKDCIMHVAPKSASNLVLDFRQYLGNVDGSKLLMSTQNTDLTIQSNLGQGMRKDVNTFEINDTSLAATITLGKQGTFYQTTTDNIMSRIDGFQIFEPTIQNAPYIEYIGGKNVYYLWHPVDGIVETELNSPGVYGYKFLKFGTGEYVLWTASWSQSFELSREAGYNSPAKLIIDKPSRLITENDFERIYGISPETSYVSMIHHRLILNGAVQYSKPAFEWKGLNPIAENMPAGKVMMVKLIDSDGFLKTEYAENNNVNLTSNNVLYEKDSTSGGVIFYVKAPTASLRISGNSDKLYPVYTSDSKKLRTDIYLDQTNTLVNASLDESQLTEGDSYTFYFDDTHIYGGVENGKKYRLGGLNTEFGSSALKEVHLSPKLIISSSNRQGKDIITQYSPTSNVSFFGPWDDESKDAFQTVVTSYYGNGSMIQNCNTSMSWYFGDKKSSYKKTIIGSLMPVMLFLPFFRRNRKGQMMWWFIFLGVLVVLLLSFVSYMYPSWGTILPQYVIQNQVLENNKNSVHDYGNSCMNTALACALQRTGSSNGNFYYPSSGTSFDQVNDFLETVGTECIGGFDVEHRNYNIIVSDAKAKTAYNAKDVSTIVHMPVTLNKGFGLSRITDFTADIPIRFSWNERFAKSMQEVNHARKDVSDIDLRKPETEHILINVYGDVKDISGKRRTYVETIDPESYIWTTTPYRWLWII